MSARERGAGTVLAVSVVAVILVCFSLLLPLATGLVARAQLAGAADATALAAADAAIGIAPGIPCQVAASVARANRVELRQCQPDGAIVTVRVGTIIFGLPVSASATAGPASASR